MAQKETAEQLAEAWLFAEQNKNAEEKRRCGGCWPERSIDISPFGYNPQDIVNALNNKGKPSRYN